MQLDNFITVGKIISSFGLKGQVKVDIHLEDLTVLKAFDTFCVGDALLKSKINFLKKTKKSIWIAAMPETKTPEVFQLKEVCT